MLELKGKNRVRRTYRLPTAGMDEVPEAPSFRTYRDGSTRQVLYVNGRKVVRWTFPTEDKPE